MYYVYIISNETDAKYIGATKDLRRRLMEHNSGGVRYTKSKKNWMLMWYCAFENKEKAYAFEKYLKSSSGHAFMNKRFL